jgi:hypothetical protein
MRCSMGEVLQTADKPLSLSKIFMIHEAMELLT